MNSLVSIMILNWNRPEETQRAIYSALNQTYKNCEIVVIDNGSSDHSVELTKKNFPDIKVIQLDKNYGCPGGRNRGIRHCKGDYIFYLDNDGVLHEKAVENAIATLLKFKNTGIVTGKLYDFEFDYQINTKIEISQKTAVYYNREFQGGISLHKKEIYNKIGYYPEHFMYGAEELYLSLKLLETEYKIIRDESVILWHKKSQIARYKTEEKLHGYYNKLFVAISLYPALYAGFFFLYFPFKYFFYSKTEKIMLPFLKSLLYRYWSTFIEAIKRRNPISLQAYHTFQNFESESLETDIKHFIK